MALATLVKVPGTDWSDAHSEGNVDSLNTAIAAIDTNTTDLDAVELKTAMLTNATAGAGAKIVLAEPTGGGTSTVTIQAPSLTGNRVITVPDADVTLANIALNTAFRIANAPNILTDGGLVADAAAIPANTSAQYQIATAAAETNTLDIPAAAGIEISLYCTVHAVGDRVVTVASPINQAGNTIMTFGAVGDWIDLISIVTTGGALAWRVRSNDGVALS